MRFYEDIESEIKRIQKCISRFGWTSDHNLDWWVDSIVDKSGNSVFVEFDDGAGLLAQKYPDRWEIWSDPLSKLEEASQKLLEFSKFVLTGDINPALDPTLKFKGGAELKSGVRKVLCVDVSDTIYLQLKKDNFFNVGDIEYSLFWPVLDMEKYDPTLPGRHFKEIRNAKNKFYREHKVKVVNTNELDKNDLYRIVDYWQKEVTKKQKPEDVYDLRYRNAVENNFRGFITSRVLIADGQPVGFNAGYEVPNRKGRLAGVIGLHDYSLKDLGVILWLEDLEWIKNAGYKELDMQGTEYDWEIKGKTQYGAVVERKTNTFSLKHFTK